MYKALLNLIQKGFNFVLCQCVLYIQGDFFLAFFCAGIEDSHTMVRKKRGAGVYTNIPYISIFFILQKTDAPSMMYLMRC